MPFSSDSATALAQAKALLPMWVVYGPALFVPLWSFLLAASITWMQRTFLLAPLRKNPHMHWSACAQILAPYRTAIFSSVIFLPIAFQVMWFWKGAPTAPLLHLPAAYFSLSILLATLFGVRWMYRDPQFAWRETMLRGLGFRLLVNPVLIIIILTPLCITITNVRTLWWIVLFDACVLNIGFFGISVWIDRLLRIVTPAPERVYRVVARECAAANLPMPRLFLLRSSVANAAAMFLSNTLLFTPNLLAALNDDELASVVRHELAHVHEPRGVKWQRVFWVNLTALPIFFIPLLVEHPMPFGVVFAVAVFLIALKMQSRLSQRMERRADAHGVGVSDGAIHARALEKIYCANLAPVIARSRIKSHPDLYDRMLATGVTPDYPRPTPAPRNTRALCTTMLLLFVGLVAPHLLQLRAAHSRPMLLAHMALNGAGAWEFGQLGWLEWDALLINAKAVEALANFLHNFSDGVAPADQQKTATAIANIITWYRAAETLEPTSAYYPAVLSDIYVMTGDCAAAEAALVRMAARFSPLAPAYVAIETGKAQEYWAQSHCATEATP